MRLSVRPGSASKFEGDLCHNRDLTDALGTRGNEGLRKRRGEVADQKTRIAGAEFTYWPGPEPCDLHDRAAIGERWWLFGLMMRCSCERPICLLVNTAIRNLLSAHPATWRSKVSFCAWIRLAWIVVTFSGTPCPRTGFLARVSWIERGSSADFAVSKAAIAATKSFCACTRVGRIRSRTVAVMGDVVDRPDHQLHDAGRHRAETTGSTYPRRPRPAFGHGPARNTSSDDRFMVRVAHFAGGSGLV